MQVKILTKEEAAERPALLMSNPFFRPSHRVVNIFDKANDTVYLTEFQDFMGSRKEEFNMSCQRNLAIETTVDDLLQFLPEDVRGMKDIMAFTTGQLYFVIAGVRYFVIGQRIWSNAIEESRTDGLELLGEVSVTGEFRPVWLPRFGFAIRALGFHEHRTGQSLYLRDDADSFEINQRRRDHAGIFILLNSQGEPIFEDFDEDNAQLRLFLGTPSEIDADFGWRIRNWSYPRLWEPDGDNSYRSRRYSRQGIARRFTGHGWAGEASFEPGSGKVTITTRDGLKREDDCVPWAECAFVETFYS